MARDGFCRPRTSTSRRSVRLLKITGENLSSPADPRSGVVWKSKSAGSDADQVDERIVAAAGLARFLQAGMPAVRPRAIPRRCEMIEIIVTEIRQTRPIRGEFARERNSAGAVRRGPKSPESRPRTEKWQVLLRWNESSRESRPGRGDYWAFSMKGLAHRSAPIASGVHIAREEGLVGAARAARPGCREGERGGKMSG